MRPALKTALDQLQSLINKELGRSMGLGGADKTGDDSRGSVDGDRSASGSTGDNNAGAGTPSDAAKAKVPGEPSDFRNVVAGDNDLDDMKKQKLMALLKGE